MANRDPHDQGRMYETEHRMANVPRTVEPRGQGWSFGTMAAAAIGMLLILVGIMYAMSDQPASTATTTPAPSTIGQGGSPSQPVENAPDPLRK